MIYLFNERIFKKLIHQGSSIDLSGIDEKYKLIAELFNKDIIDDEVLKHESETIIMAVDIDSLILLLSTCSFEYSIHKFLDYDVGYFLIVTTTLANWRKIVINGHDNNDIQQIINKVQLCLEHKYPLLFKDYSKKGNKNLFRLELK